MANLLPHLQAFSLATLFVGVMALPSGCLFWAATSPDAGQTTDADGGEPEPLDAGDDGGSLPLDGGADGGVLPPDDAGVDGGLNPPADGGADDGGVDGGLNPPNDGGVDGGLNPPADAGVDGGLNPPNDGGVVNPQDAGSQSGGPCAGWPQFLNVTFDGSAPRPTRNLVHFPILVDLSATAGLLSSPPPVFEPRTLEGETLPFDVDHWDSEKKLIWVRIPQLSIDGGDALVFCFNQDPDASPTVNDPTFVWSADYASVHHMTTTSDSTGLNANFSQESTTLSASTAMFGRSRGFDGTHDRIDFDVAAANSAAAGTFSIWVNSDGPGASQNWVIHGAEDRLQNGHNPKQIHLYDEDGIWKGRVDQSTLDYAPSSVSTGQWQHVALTWTSSSTIGYIDGDEFVNVAEGPGALPLLRWTYGDIVNPSTVSSSERHFLGNLDEARISTIDRSSEWIRMTFAMGARTYVTTGPLQDSD